MQKEGGKEEAVSKHRKLGEKEEATPEQQEVSSIATSPIVSATKRDQYLKVKPGNTQGVEQRTIYGRAFSLHLCSPGGYKRKEPSFSFVVSFVHNLGFWSNSQYLWVTKSFIS